jgi:hypothetical protein
MALAGGLLSAGLSVDDAKRFVEAVALAAGDDEVDDRVKAVETTAARINAGEPVTGWTTLHDLLTGDGRKVCDKVREWLGVPQGGGSTGGSFEVIAQSDWTTPSPPDPSRGSPLPGRSATPGTPQ